jgi:predicted GNAT family N-acyltransferase
MSLQFEIVRVFGGSLHATRYSATLYDSAIQLRERYLWAVENCSMDDYVETDRHSVHFFATTTEPYGDTDAVIGTVQYDPDTNRLRQMVVDESYRRCDVGSSLVDAVKEEAIDKYKQESLKVHAWLESALFYVKHGFVAEGDAYKRNGVLCQVMTFSPRIR